MTAPRILFRRAAPCTMRTTSTSRAAAGSTNGALAGDWDVGPARAALANEAGAIVFRFHARDLHLVLGPSAAGQAIRFRVLIDGNPPAEAHGADIDAQGMGVVNGQRLYQLIRQDGPVTDRQFEIEFSDPGAQAFAFTFG